MPPAPPSSPATVLVQPVPPSPNNNPPLPPVGSLIVPSAPLPIRMLLWPVTSCHTVLIALSTGSPIGLRIQACEIVSNGWKINSLNTCDGSKDEPNIAAGSVNEPNADSGSNEPNPASGSADEPAAASGSVGNANAESTELKPSVAGELRLAKSR